MHTLKHREKKKKTDKVCIYCCSERSERTKLRQYDNEDLKFFLLKPMSGPR